MTTARTLPIYTLLALVACSPQTTQRSFVAPQHASHFTLAVVEDAGQRVAEVATPEDAGSTSEIAAAPDAAPVAVARVLTLDERLAEHEVDDDRPWRETVYSWLTPQRAAELAQHRTLLTATPSSGPNVSPFSRLVARMRHRRDAHGAIARALQSAPDLSRYRYAWSSPFATAMGFRGQPYGTALVRVDLRPDALVLRLDPQDSQPFRLFDREQREVAIDRFEAVRARIAAVYHVRRGRDVSIPFREYVLCSARPVARWSVGATVIREEITRERALIEDVLNEWTTLSTTHHTRTVLEWKLSTRAAVRTPATRWAAVMATAAPHYELDAHNLRALVQQLALYDDSAQHEETLAP